MQHTPKVSVIIPVYQAKEHIGETIQCLQTQTLQELEFLFINDKGEDGTFDIVKNAAKNDTRIVLLENETNSGPGICRNKGIEKARGEFIAFVDADDKLSPDFYEKLYCKAKDTGALAVKSNVVEIMEDGSQRVSPRNRWIKEWLKNSPSSMLNLWYCEHWAGIYSRNLVMQTGARNCESARRDEDTCFQMMLMIHVHPEQFAMEESVSYFYVQQPNSLVHKPKNAYYLEQMRLSAEFKINFMLQQPVEPENTRYLAGIIDHRLSQALDLAINGVASINKMLEYIQYFSNIIKKSHLENIQTDKFPAIQLMRMVDYDAGTYLAMRIQAVGNNKKPDNLFTIVKRLEYYISLLARRKELERQYSMIRLKLLFSFGKKKAHLKERKALIKKQLLILRQL
ncbi:MAG: glycosyltransferase family 2 protein [Akkermansia sp.]|nr:glycosyltransferase family 2 protein [Akkermansia sp.]